MLEKPLRDQILDLVRQKPRTVQEIALTIQKNWRTADRYIDEISRETGLIASRTFREGSRGALKIVYWNALDRAKGSAYQERLLHKILQGKRKEDFSPFDIYQFVDETKRQAILETSEYSAHNPIRFDALLAETQQQLLVFSGNLSWMDLTPNSPALLEEAVKRKVHCKVLSSVNITSRKNTELLLSLNQRSGRDAIEVRHCEQPLRALIGDDSFLSLKEVLNPQHYRTKELAEKTFIFYLIKDPEWIHWLQKVFWQLWGQSIDAQERLRGLDSVHQGAYIKEGRISLKSYPGSNRS